MISASYYYSPSYQPPEEFYDFSQETMNYTYYYDDKLYVANYTVVTKTLKEEEEPIPMPEEILNLHPFQFFAMLVCIISLLILFSYIVSVHAAFSILKKREFVNNEGKLNVVW